MGLVCRGWHTTLLQDVPRSVHFRLVGNEIDERIAWARISICPSWGVCCFNEHIRNVPLNLDAPRPAPDHAEPWHCALDSINQIRHLNVEISDAAQALSLVRRLTVPGAEIAVDSLTLRAQYAGARSRHVRGGGWQFLAPALQRCKIRSLSLPQCVLLGDNGARAIAVALNHPQCCLQSISVCFCGIHDVGAAAFAGEICREGNLLTHLNVSTKLILINYCPHTFDPVVHDFIATATAFDARSLTKCENHSRIMTCDKTKDEVHTAPAGV